jgi:uncharacterized protein YjaG (DUF416 family)
LAEIIRAQLQLSISDVCVALVIVNFRTKRMVEETKADRKKSMKEWKQNETHEKDRGRETDRQRGRQTERIRLNEVHGRRDKDRLTSRL